MTSRRFSILFGLAATFSATSLLTGCPNPEGSFDEFVERYDAIYPPTSATTTGTGGASACTPVAAGTLDGTYLFSLSAKLSPKKAFALEATLVTHAAGDGLTADLELQPLSAMDQTTPVSTPLSYTDLPVNADGSFVWDFGMVTLPGAANPITGADVETTLVLDGALCEEGMGFLCGNASGQVTVPLMYDLAGSSWTMQLVDGGTLPTPLINCAMDPAQY